MLRGNSKTIKLSSHYSKTVPVGNSKNKSDCKEVHATESNMKMKTNIKLTDITMVLSGHKEQLCDVQNTTKN
jgi:hypothetical protein